MDNFTLEFYWELQQEIEEEEGKWSPLFKVFEPSWV